jgi:nucleoside-diphosphate-sugar epimerase
VKVLVTGAAGFVGAEIVRALRTAGVDVVAAVRGQKQRLPLSVACVPLELADIDSIRRALDTRPDAIIHAAGYGAVVSAERDAVRMVNVNVAGSLAIHAAAAARGVGRFIHLGSAIEYGSSRDALHEEAELRPRGAYAASKLAAYLALSEQGRSKGLPPVTLRLFNLFGPADDPSRLGGQIIRAARDGTRASLTLGNQRRDFSFVRDVARRIAVVTLLSADYYPVGGTFNVASGRPVLVREFALSLSRALGVEHLIDLGTHTERNEAPNDMFADITKLRVLFQDAGRADALRETPLDVAAYECLQVNARDN